MWGFKVEISSFQNFQSQLIFFFWHLKLLWTFTDNRGTFMHGQKCVFCLTRALERDSMSTTLLTTLPGVIPSLVTYSLVQYNSTQQPEVKTLAWKEVSISSLFFNKPLIIYMKQKCSSWKCWEIFISEYLVTYHMVKYIWKFTWSFHIRSD